MKAWGQSGALADWQQRPRTIKTISYTKDVASPSFQYDGAAGPDPPDRPALRHAALAGDLRRPRRARASGGKPSADYYKIVMPEWAFGLAPEPLSAEEQQAVQQAP